MTRVDVPCFYYALSGINIIVALQEFVLLGLRKNDYLTINGNNYPSQQHHTGNTNMHQHFKTSNQARNQLYPVKCINFHVFNLHDEVEKMGHSFKDMHNFHHIWSNY